MSEQKDKKALAVDTAEKSVKKKTPEPPKEQAYTKAQLVKATRYANRRDVLSVVLVEGEKYTFGEVDARIDRFMKGKV